MVHQATSYPISRILIHEDTHDVSWSMKHVKHSRLTHTPNNMIVSRLSDTSNKLYYMFLNNNYIITDVQPDVYSIPEVK